MEQSIIFLYILNSPLLQSFHFYNPVYSVGLFFSIFSYLYRAQTINWITRNTSKHVCDNKILSGIIFCHHLIHSQVILSKQIYKLQNHTLMLFSTVDKVIMKQTKHR